jgi:nicotinamidase-related amidase
MAMSKALLIVDMLRGFVNHNMAIKLLKRNIGAKQVL